MMLRSIVVFLQVFLFAATVNAQNTQIGVASFYADKFDGRATASGEIFRQNNLTAAHRELPFGTMVSVTNLANNKTVTVRINDRGPFVDGRIIDLSKSAAQQLDFVSAGVARVKIEVVASTRTATAPQKAPEEKVVAVRSPAPPVAEKQPASTIANSALEYYKINADAVVPSGLGIQVASYREAANLMARCNEIKEKYKKEVLVQVGNDNGDKIYRVIIGTFSTREEADKYNKSLRSDFPGSFVVEF